MPNGGTDCCGNCFHNTAVKKLGRLFEDRAKFWELSHCELRDLNISEPFWTFCESFTEDDQPEDSTPHGPVYCVGTGETYERIPWVGTDEPKTNVSANCLICSIATDQGIRIDREWDPVEFCGNAHYLEWWNDNFRDPENNDETRPKFIT